MKKLNPDHVAAVQKIVNFSPYFSLLSMGIVSLEPGRSVLKIDLQEKHLQPYGMVHGGVYSSMIDAACFWAGYTEIEEHLGLTTVEMKLNYLAPASSGVFMAQGESCKNREKPLPERGRHCRPRGETAGPRHRHHDGSSVIDNPGPDQASGKVFGLAR
jgi:uncharacterized protein (TIGR00369 family)